MRLVACSSCHAQFDVTDVVEPQFRCHCGETLENVSQTAIDARVQRCSSCGASLPPAGDTCEFCGSVVIRDTRKLSLICPECLARNTETAQFCTHCGVRFQPQPVLEVDFERQCPCCDCAMPPRSVGGMRLHECPQCHGLWVPGENFDALVEKAIDAQRTQPTAGIAVTRRRHDRRSAFSGKIEYRRCPVCQAQMLRKNFGKRSGVIIDWCRQHGTWLDADELEDIAAFITRGGLAPSEPANQAPPQLLTGLHGASAEQIEAVIEAERLLAKERDSGRRASGFLDITVGKRRHDRRDGGNLLGNLGDLFQAILGD